jgi:hypothetical protein
MTESSIHQPIRRGWLVLRPRSTYVYSDSIVIGILFFFYMECVTVYHIIVSTMIEDGIVNAGWLYVLYVFTQSYCAQYPDRTSDIWRIYDQITNQSNGRNFNQWDGRIQCPSTNQKPGERTNQKTGYKKKRPIDSIHTKLTKKNQIERVQPIKWQDFWPMRLQNPVSINQSDCKKWTNQKRVTSFTSASEQYIQRQNRHWHYGFFDRPMPCNVNITKLSPWITFCWWTRRQWGKSRTNWFKTKSWTIKWEFIRHHPTRKGLNRALLEILPRRDREAFHAFCRALLSLKRDDLVKVLTNPDTEDMEMCFPEQSSFHLGGNLYLIAEQDGILLTDKNTMSDIYFPLVRWVQLQTTWGYIDDAVHYLEHNRYTSLDVHLGANVFVTAESSFTLGHSSNSTWRTRM